MVRPKSVNIEYTKEETRQRFEAALRGARIAGPQHVESVTPKRAKPQRKKRKKTKGGEG